jgi:phenylalanyl-tRNA synthetase beta chain
MKVSRNWLSEYVELPANVSTLVDLLTLAGIEVEGVVTRGCALDKVVVAQIQESVPHPNADRLSVCTVDDGSGALRQIVCGAKNYRVGDKVPLALPGAVLPGDFKIKVGKLRGVESQGMLCSGKELNLADDAEGLLILSPDAKVGAPIGEIFPTDTILDLEITPNRADLLSHWGIAREIGALTKKNVQPLPTTRRAGAEADAGASIDVEIAPGTPRVDYTARVVRGVKVGASPAWLQTKLEAVGLRPINNVVDVTNYIMLLCGQPLHAFDAAQVHGGICVRLANADEQFLALDGKKYALAAGDLVIADRQVALAIAGVMGGEESGVTEATRDVILESARFEPASIRRTSRRLGLVSDSSYRFERGVDPVAVHHASELAAGLLAEVCGAVSISSKTHCQNDPDFSGDPWVPPAPITLRPSRVNALLGVKIDEKEIENILTAFGVRKSADGYRPDSRRADLTREIDLIEELSRVIGMDRIAPRTEARFAPENESDRRYDRAMKLRRACVAHGLHEARSVTLVPHDPLGIDCIGLDRNSMQAIKNPMIDDQVVLRPHLLHGLLNAVRTNVRNGARSIRLFEIGRVFSKASPGENEHLAIVLAGPIESGSWRGNTLRDADVFDMKGIVAGLAPGSLTFAPKESGTTLALPLAVKRGGNEIGVVGQLWPADARALDATAPVIVAELDLDAWRAAEQSSQRSRHREIPRFPSTARDIALLAPLDLPHARIENVLASANEPLLAAIELFDLFTDLRGEKIPADKKSMAYSLTYRAPDRTLTADEVNAAHARLKERLKSELGVVFRE